MDSNPGPFGSAAPCPSAASTAAEDSLIEIDRVEGIRLPALGSTATIPIALRTVHFSVGIVGHEPPLYCPQRWRALSLTMLAPVGVMVVRRDTERGGSYELRLSVYLDAVLEGQFFPRPRLGTRLGPYDVVLAARWNVASDSSPWCRSCTAEFVTEREDRRAVPLWILGSGTSPPERRNDPIHLDQSRFGLPLYPACYRLRFPTATRASPWTAVKELFR